MYIELLCIIIAFQIACNAKKLQTIFDGINYFFLNYVFEQNIIR